MAGTDNVEKEVRRGDAEGALQALLRLPEAERAALVEPVGALFRQAVQAAHHAKDWSKLTFWASRAEKLPALANTPAAHWALTWAAIKTKEWDRAARWFQPLEPVLAAKSPAFAQALAAVVARAATPEQVSPFLPGPAAIDPRLGHEPKRVRIEWAAPASPEAAEKTLLAMVGREPFGVFSARVEQWAEKVDEATRRRIWELAGALSMREALTRATAEQLVDPAELLCLSVLRLGAPASLADEAVLMLRLASSRTSGQVTSASAARPLAIAARTVSAYPQLRSLAIAVVTARTFTAGAAGPILRLLEHLAAQQADAEVVGKALLLLSIADPNGADEYRPSPDLVRALKAAIQTHPAALGGWFQGLEPEKRENLAGWMSYVVPVEVVQDFILAVWAAAPTPRETLLAMVENVLVRLGDVEEFDADPLDQPLNARSRPFWNAVRDLVLSEDETFLGFALREARPEERPALLARVLGGKQTVEKMLGIWDELRQTKQTAAMREVESKMFVRFGADQHALIHAVVECEALRLPIALKRKFAQALLAQAHLPCECSERARALRLATRWLTKPPPKPKKPAAKPRRTTPDDDDPIPF